MHMLCLTMSASETPNGFQSASASDQQGAERVRHSQWLSFFSKAPCLSQ